MLLEHLKQHIRNKTTPNLLIFTGEEEFVMKNYINKITKVHDLIVKRPEDVKELIQEVGIQSFTDKRRLYIIRDDKSFIKNEKLWESLHKIINADFLIFIYPKLDKREKFYKYFTKNAETSALILFTGCEL